MRVLVTGHLGYIGTVLCPMVISVGHEVAGLDIDLLFVMHVFRRWRASSDSLYQEGYA